MNNFHTSKEMYCNCENQIYSPILSLLVLKSFMPYLLLRNILSLVWKYLVSFVEVFHLRCGNVSFFVQLKVEETAGAASDLWLRIARQVSYPQEQEGSLLTKLLPLHQTRARPVMDENFPNYCGKISSLVWKFFISGIEIFHFCSYPTVQ